MVNKMLLNLWEIMRQRTMDIDEYLTNLGWFLIITFPVFYIINKFMFRLSAYDNFFLRFSVGLLALIFITRNHLPKKAKVLMPLIFYWTALYGFPFFFSFLLLNNPNSYIWKLNVLCGLFFLSFFFNWKEYIILSLSGFFLAWLVFYLTSIDAQLPLDSGNLLITYMSPVIYLALFSRKKDNITQEKLLAMKTLAGTVAHEMRTPFLGIRANAGCIKKFLPALIDGYGKAKNAQLEVQPLSEKDLTHLIETPDDLEKITTSASLVIDMLLMSLKDKGQNGKDYKPCSVRACISETLHEYPLTEEESALVSWEDTPDFTFHGNALLMKHVLFNLLKNALYYVKAAQKGGISLWTEFTPKENILYFKDTGKGMPASVLSHIFDRFYAHTRHGTGIGLAFCKSVMEGFGGTISCESKEGEHTTFILKFPVIREPKMNG